MWITIFNATLYFLTLILYWGRRKKINCGFILLSLYTFVSFMGILEVISNPTRWDLRVWPFLYLYVSFMLFFRPVLFDSDKLQERLVVNNFKTIKFLSIIIILFSFLSIYFYYPVAAENFRKGNWLEIRTNHYLGEIEIFSNALVRIIANLSTHLRLAGTVLFFYFLTKPNASKIIKLLLGVSIIIPPILIAATTASRDVFFELFMSLIVCYFIFKNGIPAKIKRLIITSALIFFSIAIIISAAITLSRFGEEKQGGSLLFYFSHSFLTFNYGLTDSINNYLYGDLFFGRIYDLITGHSGKPIPLDISTGTHMSTSFFTFVGAWYIDFGPIGTLIAAITIPYFFSAAFKGKQYVTIANVFAYLFYMSYLIRGVFVPARGIAFNWAIALFIFFLLKLTIKNKNGEINY